jgi:C1A family cysteine protease
MIYKLSSVLVVSWAALILAAPAPGLAPTDPEWEAFKTKFKKSYTSPDDEDARHTLFKVAQQRVGQLNQLNGQKAFGINWMSDRYPHEQHKTGLKKPKDFVSNAEVREYTPRTGKSINWRYTEAVTAIKNQGQCGSCWAFSATEAVESQMILSTGGDLAVALSPQQITSCTPSTGTYGCDGCNGGFTEGAYEYLKSAPGLANAFFIPYGQSLTETSNTLSCPTSKVNQITGELEELQGGFAKVEGYHYATPPCTSGACASQDLSKLQAALEHTPVSVCVNAGVWNDYVGGVLTADACGGNGAGDIDHCVQLVGYDSEGGWFLVRNSWSTSWSEDGYLRLAIDGNACGVANEATVAVVEEGE